MIEKLREELIKDIVSYLDKSVIDQDVDYIDVQNTITQIIVDTFDEYELNNNQYGNKSSYCKRATKRTN